MEQQKVKLQVSCDLEDVPSFCAHSLGEVASRVQQLESVVAAVKQKLMSTDFTDKDALANALVGFDNCRLLLMKVDARLGDTASILGGLVKILENPEGEKEQTKEVVDDSSNSG